MGIRFACHQCGKRLNIKSELAGRRGVCPACSARFRIPLSDAEKSLPVEQKPDSIAASSSTASTPTPPSSRRLSARETGSPKTKSRPVGEGLPQGAPSSVASAPANDAFFSSEEDVGEERAGGQGAGEQREGEVPASEEGFEGKPFNVDPAVERPPSAELLSEHEPEAIWYVRPPSGNQYGPASTELLRQWIGEGRVAATSLLWRDGWPQWRTAVEVLPELADRLPGAGKAADASGEPFAGAFPAEPTPGQGGIGQGETRPAGSAVDLAGQATVGAERRVRSSRRVMWIGVLAAVALMLVGLLVVVANRG